MTDKDLQLVPDDADVTRIEGLSPADRLAQATQIANALASVIEQKRLFVSIQGKRHVLAEGWQVLASLMQVGLETEWTRPLYDADAKGDTYGWEARVVARSKDGQVLGSAESMCTRDEKRWKTADDFAIRSMAQTRAVSRTLRQCIGFIVKLSGFEATPADEMPEPSAPAPRETPLKPLDGAEKNALWELAKEAGARTNVKADLIINEVCKDLDVEKTSSGWQLRKRDYAPVERALKEWKPAPADPPGEGFY